MQENRRTRLTDAIVERLKPTNSGVPYRVADAEQAGLFVIVGRRTTTYTAQGDLRINGRRAHTRKRVLGHAPDMSVREARAAAREFLGRLAQREDPERQRTKCFFV
jgi:Arm domain-containing DNA-binding protein